MIIPGLNILDMKPICIGDFAIVHCSIIINIVIVTNNTIVIIFIKMQIKINTSDDVFSYDVASDDVVNDGVVNDDVVN
jgi:hypothetical protein